MCRHSDILEQFKRFIAKANEGELTAAEVTYWVENFDPAELYQYEQENELSIALLEEWLAKYKFRNWRETETEAKKSPRKCGKNGHRKSPAG